MNKLTTISTKLCMAFALIFMLGVGSSQASLMLKVTDFGNPTDTVNDNNAPAGTQLDTSGIVGFLSASFATANFSVVSSSGASKPLAPNSGTVANLDLLQLAITANNDGWLTIELSDNNFALGGPAIGTMLSSIGGTLGANALNSVQVDYYYNTSNVKFDTAGATKISTPTFSGGGAFGGDFGPAAVAGINGPFSLTQVATIHMKAGQIISFDSDQTVVPEPGMLFLIGLGLIGLTFASRRSS